MLGEEGEEGWTHDLVTDSRSPYCLRLRTGFGLGDVNAGKDIDHLSRINSSNSRSFLELVEMP